MQHRRADVPVVRHRVFGTVMRHATFHDAALVEIRYAAHTMLPLHAHDASFFLLTVAGSFDETIGMRSRSCGPRHLVHRPVGEEHAQQFGSHGATCFAIELPPTCEHPVTLKGNGADLRGAPALFAMRLYDEPKGTKRPGGARDISGPSAACAG